jgi:hypothetical protein
LASHWVDGWEEPTRSNSPRWLSSAFRSFDGSFGAENWVQPLRVLLSRFDLLKIWLRADLPDGWGGEARERLQVLASGAFH